MGGWDSSITGTHSFSKCFHVGLCPGGIKSQWYRGGFCLCQFTFTKCTRSHQVSVATTGVIVVAIPVYGLLNLVCSVHLLNRKGIASLSSWSVNMTVNVIGGEGCRSFGDAMRELDSKALIRGNFVLLGSDTITNADLRPIFEQHK